MILMLKFYLLHRITLNQHKIILLNNNLIIPQIYHIKATILQKFYKEVIIKNKIQVKITIVVNKVFNNH